MTTVDCRATASGVSAAVAPAATRASTGAAAAAVHDDSGCPAARDVLGHRPSHHAQSNESNRFCIVIGAPSRGVRYNASRRSLRRWRTYAPHEHRCARSPAASASARSSPRSSPSAASAWRSQLRALEGRGRGRLQRAFGARPARGRIPGRPRRPTPAQRSSTRAAVALGRLDILINMASVYCRRRSTS